MKYKTSNAQEIIVNDKLLHIKKVKENFLELLKSNLDIEKFDKKQIDCISIGSGESLELEPLDAFGKTNQMQLNYTGVDIDPHVINLISMDVATKQLLLSNDNYTLLCTDANKYEFKNKFNLILLKHPPIFEPTQTRYFNNIFANIIPKLIAENGIILITCPLQHEFIALKNLFNKYNKNCITFTNANKKLPFYLNESSKDWYVDEYIIKISYNSKNYNQCMQNLNKELPIIENDEQELIDTFRKIEKITNNFIYKQETNCDQNYVVLLRNMLRLLKKPFFYEDILNTKIDLFKFKYFLATSHRDIANILEEQYDTLIKQAFNYYNTTKTLIIESLFYKVQAKKLLEETVEIDLTTLPNEQKEYLQKALYNLIYTICHDKNKDIDFSNNGIKISTKKEKIDFCSECLQQIKECNYFYGTIKEQHVQLIETSIKKLHDEINSGNKIKYKL